MQSTPISATELTAWINGTMANVGPVDFQDVLSISRVFVGAMDDYSGKMIDPPWIPPLTAEEEAEHNRAQERVFDVLFGINTQD